MIAIFLVVISVIIAFFVWQLCSRYFSLPCPSWLAWLVERDNPFSKINRASIIIDHLDIQSGMTVLDAGCGPGRLTIPLANKVGPSGNVVALDIQSEMLNRVMAKVKAAHVHNVTFLNCALGENQLPSHVFDRACLVTVLGEIPHQKKALEEIYNSLKHGGILCITEIILDPHYQRYDKVIQLAQEVGFYKLTMFCDWCAYTLLLKKE